MENLIASGSDSIAGKEIARLDALARKAEARRAALSPKTYHGYDATQGTYQLRGAAGGIASTAEQGSLSTGAIARGEPVRSYGWRVADWKPGKPTGQQAQVADSNPVDSRTGRSGGASTTAPPDLPEEPPESPDSPSDGYCQTQCFWYRGVPYEAPDEGLPEGCFEGGQCPVTYRVEVTATAEYDSFSGPSDDYQYQTFYERNLAGPITSVGPGTQSGGYTSTNPGPSIAITYAGGTGTFAPQARSNRSQPTRNGNHQVIRIDSVSFARLDGQPDDCGNPPGCDPAPSYGPPMSADPKIWRSLCSSASPIRVSNFTDSERTLLTIHDQNGEMAKLEFEQNRVQWEVRCSEEGPPNPTCQIQRMWYRKPLIISENELITHPADRGPVDYTFPGIVLSVSTSGLFNFFGGTPNTPCREPAIIGNRIYREYDSSYGDNSGTCYYDVTYEIADEGLSEWQSVVSGNPPIRTQTSQVDGVDIVAIYDEVTSPALPLTTLDFPYEGYQIRVRCDEEGLPPEG